MSPSGVEERQQQLEYKVGERTVQYECVNLLQEGELLGYVLCAVFILAEGESLLAVQADVREIIHQGAVARHRQSRSYGEGLVFRHGW